MWNKQIKLCLLLILFATSGCGKGSIAAISDYCAIAQPIAYDSAKDSADTVKAIEAHNSKWVCVCEHDCPKP